ncbi:MAG: endonuclease domain-containing protein, partial [Caulobacterales bacterium]
MTLAEKHLWDELRKLKLRIRRQTPLGRYVADFAHHGARLVIEVDSPWHDDEAAQLRDAERDQWLVSQGYRVIRVRDREIFQDAESVAARIVAEVRAAGAKARPSREPRGRTPT